MKKISKNNLITILLIAIPVIGLLSAGIFIYFRRKNKSKKTHISSDSLSPGNDPKLSEEVLFSDPSTYLDNAKQYPSKWKKFIRNLIKEAYKVGDSIKEPDLSESWYNRVQYWLREVNLKQNKPEFGLGDWLAGYSETPLAAIVTGILWSWQDQFNKGNENEIISRKEAKDMIEKVGGDPYASWLANFPEQPIIDRNNTNNSQTHTQNTN